MEFFNDYQLVVVGIFDFYICVWDLEGKLFWIMLDNEKDFKVNNRKLIGYLGFVFGIFFLDFIVFFDWNFYFEGFGKLVDISVKLLLFCFMDGQVCLWLFEFWFCFCIYRFYDGFIFCVFWGLYGYYFVMVGWDKMVCIFI